MIEVERRPISDFPTATTHPHHERRNGTGYPHGPDGYDIPKEGRITQFDPTALVAFQAPVAPVKPIQIGLPTWNDDHPGA